MPVHAVAARAERGAGAAGGDLGNTARHLPGDLQTVFEIILANATRICEAKFGSLFLREGDVFRTVATHNSPPAFVEVRRRDPLIRPRPDGPIGRVVATKQVVHIADIKTIASYVEGHPHIVAAVELGGYRTVLAVPMLKDSELVGTIHIYRQEVRPFTDKQIELVKSFAAQAVIAIENVRRFTELEAKNSNLTQALEQQTATSEVLRVISSSPTDAHPTFDAIAASATRLCDAVNALVIRFDGRLMHLAAHHNVSPERLDALQRSFRCPPPADMWRVGQY
jgi:two-component system, NtrC family, sensor kinase